MPELNEVMTKESVHRLHEAFKVGVEYLPRTKKGDYGLTQKTFNEVGYVILRAIHNELLSDSTPRSGTRMKHPEFPYASNLSLVDVATNLKLSRDGSDRPARLVYDASRVLQHSGLAQRMGGTYLLKPWDEKAVRYVSGYSVVRGKDKNDSAKPAAKPEAEVTSRIDLRVYKVPEPTVESLLEFAEKFVPAAIRLQDEYDVQSKMLRELKEWVEVLQEEISNHETKAQAETQEKMERAAKAVEEAFTRKVVK